MGNTMHRSLIINSWRFSIKGLVIRQAKISDNSLPPRFFPKSQNLRKIWSDGNEYNNRVPFIQSYFCEGGTRIRRPQNINLPKSHVDLINK